MMLDRPSVVNLKARKGPRPTSPTDAEIDAIVLGNPSGRKVGVHKVANLIDRIIRTNGGKVTIADLARVHLGIDPANFHPSSTGRNRWNQAIDLLVQRGRIEHRGRKGYPVKDRGLFAI